ncbi:MAG: Type 1 glutamine amidotransferase-like domain-containing protein [Acidobacteria bacterium]|nr:Type 1 glutamine amidotransferase-like domain-containing protein [Acidobacteriota bacterium]
MHLYLSSFLLGNDAKALVSLVRRPTALVIANALDHADTPVRESHARGSIEALAGLGFSAAELDLRDYFAAPDRLRSALIDAGLVWVNGGNVFLLRRAMRQSGFDRYIMERRGDDGLVYGGYSAGACVTGPTLRGAHLVDPPDALAAGYTEAAIWEGLGLVPYSIVPHYRSDHEEAGRIDAVVEYLIVNKLPFVALRDGEVVITAAL